MTSCFLIDPLAFWGKRFLISGIWMRKNQTPPTETYGYRCLVKFNNQIRGLKLQFTLFLWTPYTRYCGYGIWYKTGDYPNIAQGRLGYRQLWSTPRLRRPLYSFTHNTGIMHIRDYPSHMPALVYRGQSGVAWVNPVPWQYVSELPLGTAQLGNPVSGYYVYGIDMGAKRPVGNTFFRNMYVKHHRSRLIHRPHWLKIN